jgi:phosphatidylglycerophosphatase A
MNFPQPKWAALLPRETVLNLATLGPVGTALRAPGHVGFAAAGTLFVFLCLPSARVTWSSSSSPRSSSGTWRSASAGRRRSSSAGRDPGEVILDEVVAMPLCFIGWRLHRLSRASSASSRILICGFAVFRFYDIRKPGSSTACSAAGRVGDRDRRHRGGACDLRHAARGRTLLFFLVHHPAAAAA